MRGLLVPHVSRDPEEGDQDSKNNPNIDAHGNLCRVNAFPNRSPHNEKIIRRNTRPGGFPRPRPFEPPGGSGGILVCALAILAAKVMNRADSTLLKCDYALCSGARNTLSRPYCLRWQKSRHGRAMVIFAVTAHLAVPT